MGHNVCFSKLIKTNLENLRYFYLVEYTYDVFNDYCFVTDKNVMIKMEERIKEEGEREKGRRRERERKKESE